MDALTELRLRALGEEVLIDPRLLEGLRGPGQRLEHRLRLPHPHARAPAPRPGRWSPVKKLVRPFVRLYTDHVVNRQAQLNLYLAHLLHANIRETARLQVEIQELRHRCRGPRGRARAARRTAG